MARARAKSSAGSVHQRVGVNPAHELPSQALAAELGGDLGAHLLTGGEVDGQVQVGDMDPLVDEGAQAHLDPLLFGVPQGDVAEGAGIEVRAELVVDDGEDVAVEGGGDAPGVVVGGDEASRVLDEVGAQEEGVAGAQDAPDVPEEGGAGEGFLVADGGAEDGEDLAAVFLADGQQTEVFLEVSDHGVDVQTRVVPGEPGGGGGEEVTAHVHRHEPREAAVATHRVEQEPGLHTGSGSEFDECLAPAASAMSSARSWRIERSARVG
ncbi:hypothetical protein BJF83_02805 [Nocardiopsis sp. CNR-923]|nr:hypothetical protein BJF83_02805 [Nocardiopsis sp. CNR-923]